MMQDACHIDQRCAGARIISTAFFNVEHANNRVESDLLTLNNIDTFQSAGFGKGKAVVCDGGAVKRLPRAKIDAEVYDTFANFEGAAGQCVDRANNTGLIARQNLRHLKRYKHLSKSELVVNTAC